MSAFGGLADRRVQIYCGAGTSYIFQQTKHDEAVLEMKIPKGADLYAAIMLMGAIIVIWGGITFVLLKAVMF